ncbi:unnamed protein product [Heligmosomoides polygyrus]|uniref:RT_RNaseH_2 domain-containing protein n=1 Tax=Heligmosomoides polygyrus TaxID=6339 RepID=A0A183GIX7_HELPZ|nr:unnamed protein product [Heligmosomoides polygyrus]
MNTIPDHDHTSWTSDSTVKLLGIRWNLDLDTLQVPIKASKADLWLKNTDWDTPLETSDITRWTEIAKNITEFNANIPTFITGKSTCRYDLMVYSDASRRVCTAVAYLVCRPLNQKPFSNIIYAKTRIAAPEKSTIPRSNCTGSENDSDSTQGINDKSAFHSLVV